MRSKAALKSTISPTKTVISTLASSLQRNLFPPRKKTQTGQIKKKKPQKKKPRTVDVISLREQTETRSKSPVAAPKSGDPPLDIRISSEVVPDLLTKEGTQRRSDVIAANEQVVIHLHNGSATNEPVVHDRDAHAPLTLYYTKTELDSYIAYRSEGMAEKSKDWINRSSEALWESTNGEISHQTVTSLRTFVLDKYQSRDSHSKVLGFAVGFSIS